jgi:hypothetical protein
LAYGSKSTTRSTDQGGRIWRSHPNPNRCRGYIYRDVLLGCPNNHPNPLANIYVKIYVAQYDVVDGYISLSTYVGPETYIAELMRGRVRSGPGCLHRTPSALKARVHHPNQTVPRAWPTRGTNGEAATLNPPVDTLARAPACPGTLPGRGVGMPGTPGTPSSRGARRPRRPSLSRDETTFIFSKSAENWAVPKLGPPP